MEVKKITIPELMDNPEFNTLIRLYEEECRIKDLPECTPDRNQYLAMEAAGAVDVLAAYDSKLIGFGVMLSYNTPHYGKMFSSMESLFVRKDKRSSGAGLKLIQMAKRLAKARGSIAYGVCAPVNSQLHSMLSKTKMVPTNIVYTEVL